MKVQDLNLYQVKEAWEKVQNVKSDSWHQDSDMEKAIPRIFLELAEKKKPLKTGESYIDRRAKDLKTKHSCTIKGIQALSKLAEKGDTGAMRVLSDYFKQKGEDVINEWTHKSKLQAEADREVERERAEKERERKEREKQRKKEQAEQRKKERSRKEQQAHIKKYGCIMPKGLMK